jgi:hypothetical protein
MPIPRALLVLTLLAGVAALSGCESELGSLCGEPDFVNPRVPQQVGRDNLAVNLAFETCGEGACASTNGSRPYCTQTCEAASECQGMPGETWTCAPIIYFSRYGCEDWTPENDCVGSERITKYCQTTAATIADRDENFGREWDRGDGDPEPDAEPDMSMTDGGM